MSTDPTPACLAALFALAALAAGPPPAAAEQRTDGWTLTLPDRRPTDPQPAAPPPLPAGAHSLEPVTFDIVVHRGRESGKTREVHQTVSRTATRVHVAGRDGREWLFEQNPVDRRRVSATLVEHADKTIVVYEESCLRMSLGIRGWADVLALGSDGGTLSGTRRRVRIERVKPGADASLLLPAAVRFPHYRSVDYADALEKD